MRSFKKIAVILLCIGLFSSIGLNFHFKYKLDHIPRESYIDTTYYDQPVPKDSLVIRYETHYLPVAAPAPKPVPADTAYKTKVDTIFVKDSAAVQIPITQKHYKEPEYEAWISGFNPKIDSLHVFNPTTVIAPPTKKKWIETTIGLQTGLGWNGTEVHPYVGVGVQIGIPIRNFYRK